MAHIIFDVDGTLWDTTDVVAKAWQRAVTEVGVSCDPITGDILKKEFGKTMNLIADSLFPVASEHEKQRIMDLCCQFEHEDLHHFEGSLLYPKVRETLIELSKSHKVYIVSNCQSGYIELFMAKNNLTEYITDIECYGNTGRPKGENLKLLMSRNDIENAIYVGDTAGDFEATRVANIPFIYVTYGFGNIDTYEYAVDHIDDILTLGIL